MGWISVKSFKNLSSYIEILFNVENKRVDGTLLVIVKYGAMLMLKQ